jgi:hypothetical protein
MGSGAAEAEEGITTSVKASGYSVRTGTTAIGGVISSLYHHMSSAYVTSSGQTGLCLIGSTSLYHQRFLVGTGLSGPQEHTVTVVSLPP